MSSPEKIANGGVAGGPLVSTLKKLPKKVDQDEKVDPQNSCEQVSTMIASRLTDDLGFNLDQDVRQYVDVPEKRIVPYRVRRLVNPSEFYLEFTNFPKPYMYSKWFPEMQSYYGDEENRDKLRVIRNIPVVARCYACKDFFDNKWHRVRLHCVKQSGFLKVYYLDLCKTQETTIHRLLELDPDFAIPPAQVFRCYLADARPKDGLAWSEDACKLFNYLVEDKVLIGVVLERSNTLVTKGLPDFYTNLGIVLLETLPGTRAPLPDACTVNAQMVHYGFGVARGISAGCQHTTEIADYIPSFKLNCLALDPSDDPTTNPAPVENQDLAISLRELELSVKGGEEKEDEEVSVVGSVSDENLRTSSGFTFKEAEEKEIQAYYRNTTACFPTEFASHLASVNLVIVQDPCCIIVHLKSKVDELLVMQQQIGQDVENEECLMDGSPGMFVACHTSDGKEEYIWCRGIIMSKGCEEETYYMIFLVDYGCEVAIDKSFVRHLPVEFHEVPSFAIRIHLDGENVEPVVRKNRASGWTNEAKQAFVDYLSTWEEKDPHYFIYRPSHAQIFELVDFGQEFCYSDGKWVPCEVDDEEEKHFQILNEMNGHPLLSSMYVSFGVELYYEIFTEYSQQWFFQTALDLLLNCKFAKKNKSSKDHSRYHVETIESASETERIPPRLVAGLMGITRASSSNPKLDSSAEDEAKKLEE